MRQASCGVKQTCIWVGKPPIQLTHTQASLGKPREQDLRPTQRHLTIRTPTETGRPLHAIDLADPTLARAADVTGRVDRPREINATPVPGTILLVST